MTRIFVDVAAASLDSAGSHANLDPAALRSLALLADEDHEIVFVSGAEAAPPASLPAFATEVVPAVAVPAGPAALAWYLTTDVGRCQGSSARLRTILIGAVPPSGSVHRCDSVARDVQAAVLEILASEAMPPRA